MGYPSTISFGSHKHNSTLVVGDPRYDDDDMPLPLARRRASSIILLYHLALRLSSPVLLLLLGRVATASLSGLETLLESSVRSYLVGNAGSRPISEAKQPWACLVLRWGTTGEAHVLYSLSSFGREAVEAGLAWRDLAAARARGTGMPPPPPLSH